MCRLFGFRSNVESRAHRSLIVAENAMANQASYHSDGWGIGYFIDEDPYLFRTSKRLPKMILFVDSVKGCVRIHCWSTFESTVGAIDPINSHPFRYGSWIFAHNGTIFAFDKIKERMRRRYSQYINVFCLARQTQRPSFTYFQPWCARVFPRR